MSFLDLSYKQKVLYFIGIAKKVMPIIKDVKQMKIAREALECCCSQLKNGKYDGEVLYDYLDNEENGITIFAEMSDDEKESAAWNCFIDAVAFASRYAYDANNEKYFPEPIALVDNELINHLMFCYNKCISDDDYPEKLIKIVSSDRYTEVLDINKF